MKNRFIKASDTDKIVRNYQAKTKWKHEYEHLERVQKPFNKQGIYRLAVETWVGLKEKYPKGKICQKWKSNSESSPHELGSQRAAQLW